MGKISKEEKIVLVIFALDFFLLDLPTAVEYLHF